MDKIINQIISIEKKAQEMVEEAKAQSEKILSDTKTDCEKIRQEMEDRRRRRIDILTASEQENVKEQLRETQEASAKKMQSLERRFQQNKRAWVDEIYQNVIGR